MGLGLAFISFTFSPPRYNPIQLSKSRLVTGSSPIHPFVTFTPDNYAGITLPIQFDASIVGSIPFKQSSSKQTFPFFYITCLGSVSVRSKGTTINAIAIHKWLGTRWIFYAFHNFSTSSNITPLSSSLSRCNPPSKVPPVLFAPVMSSVLLLLKLQLTCYEVDRRLSCFFLSRNAFVTSA